MVGEEAYEQEVSYILGGRVGAILMKAGAKMVS
jgi:hypothetical protein